MDYSQTNLIQLLPKEIINEIVQYTSSFSLVRLASTNRSMRHMIKNVKWDLSINRFRYFIKGYQSTQCDLIIQPFSEHDAITSREYTDAIRCVSKCDIVTLHFTEINNYIATNLQHTRKLSLIKCRMKLVKNEYMLLRSISSINFIHCKQLDYSYFTELNVTTLCPSSSIKPKSSLKYLSKIKSLDLSASSELFDHDLVHLTNVTNLRLRKYSYITDDGLIFIQNVKSLYLQSCQSISGCGFVHLANLVDLTLFNCDYVDDSGFEFLTGLQNLKLGYCDKVTDEGFKFLHSLRTIYIVSCSNITDTGILYLDDTCAKCIVRCPKISKSLQRKN